MGIIRVWIEEGCVTCGNSEEVCPEVFEIDIDAGTAIVRESIEFSKSTTNKLNCKRCVCNPL